MRQKNIAKKKRAWINLVIFYYISVVCAGTCLEYLNAHKDNEEDDER